MKWTGTAASLPGIAGLLTVFSGLTFFFYTEGGPAPSAHQALTDPSGVGGKKRGQLFLGASTLL